MKIGLIALLWCVVWFLFVSNEPATDKWISKKELAYIQKGVDCAPREEVFICINNAFAKLTTLQ